MVGYPDEIVFVENSTYPRHRIKERLKKLIPFVCSECGQEPEWKGKPLTLQLEHKNGINNDNRKENLCFLCPNCHSQTETYAGRGTKGMRRADYVPKPNPRLLKRQKDKEKLTDALNDESIRFGEWGWKSRFAVKIGISSQKVMKWLQRVDPEFARGVV